MNAGAAGLTRFEGESGALGFEPQWSADPLPISNLNKHLIRMFAVNRFEGLNQVSYLHPTILRICVSSASLSSMFQTT